MGDILKYSLFFIALFLIELIYFRIVHKYNVIDRPNKRSSHDNIAFIGGGIIFYISILLYFLLNEFYSPYFFVGLSLVTIVSFLDDLKAVSIKTRIIIQVISILLMFYQCNFYIFSIPVVMVVLPLYVGILNAYNFMDGINGITGLYSIVLIVTLSYFNKSEHFVDNSLLYCIGLALLVFLFFNFRKKAICFAGDVGSISIAFIILFLLTLLILKTRDLSYIIVLAVYGVDSVLTIIHRIFLKENIFEAHRKHMYQIMANELHLSQLLVSIIYSLSQALIIIGFIYLFDYKWIYIACICVLLIVTYIFFTKKYYHLLSNK